MTTQDLELIKRGNTEILDKLYINYYGRVIGVLVYKYGCEKSIAEDLFAEAILKLRDKLIAQSIQLNNLYGYLTRTAVNLFMNYQNQKKKEKEVHTFFQSKTEDWKETDPFNQNEKDKSDKLLAMETAFKDLGEACRALLTDTILHAIPVRNLVEKYGYKNARVLTDRKGRCKKKLMQIYLDRISKMMNNG